MMHLPWTYILRGLSARPLLSLLSATVMSLAVLMLSAGQMVFRGVQQTFESSGSEPERVIVLGRAAISEVQSTIRPEQAAIVEAAIADVLGGNAAEVSKESVIVLSMRQRIAANRLNVAIRGLPTQHLPAFRAVSLSAGRMPKPGLQEVLVGASLAGRIEGGQVGQSIQIGASTWAVVGTIARRGDMTDSEIWCDVDLLNSDALHGPLFSSLRTLLPGAAPLAKLKETLERDPRLSVTVWQESAYHRRLSRSLIGFVRVFGIGAAGLFAIIAGLGVCALVWASLPWRRRDHGLMMALGFTRSDVVGSVLVEQLILGVVGAIGGTLLAALLSWFPFVGYSSETFSEAAFDLRLTPVMALVSGTFVVVVAALAGVLASMRVSQAMPVLALRAK